MAVPLSQTVAYPTIHTSTEIKSNMDIMMAMTKLTKKEEREEEKQDNNSDDGSNKSKKTK